MKHCVVCHTRPATLPDRESMGRPIKRVCHECHAQRLIEDLKAVLKRVELDKEKERR
jgi:hypothetical protein